MNYTMEKNGQLYLFSLTSYGHEYVRPKNVEIIVTEVPGKKY